MIKKYLDAFPNSNSYICDDSKKAFFIRNFGDSKKLMFLDLTKSLNYSDAVEASNEDFSKRSYRHIKYFKNSNSLWFRSDTDNTEDFNIFVLDLSTQKISKITDCTYCGIFGLDDQATTLVYGDRYKTENGLFSTKLYYRNLITGEEKEIFDDKDQEYRLSWSLANIDLAKGKVYVSVDKDNKRRFANLLEIDIETGARSHLLPKELECPQIYLFDRGVLENNLYFGSELTGFNNIYHLDLTDRKITSLTDHKLSNSYNHINVKEGKLYSLLSSPKTDETILEYIELDGKTTISLIESRLKGAYGMVDSEDLWLYKSNIDSPSTFYHYEFKEKIPTILSTIVPYEGKKEDLVHNHYKFVEYETFDGKIVPAFLSLPNKPLRGAIITAFYGGANTYSFVTQLFSELGIAVLSPGVRGTHSYGSEWRQLIKGDLGGNEILDVHWGARYLEKELQLKPHQIGVKGGSHGGYSVLRCMTMPQNFKGLEDTVYPYGFGVCWAGFADLEDFYKTSNIPDWLVDMLGPYEENSAKYKERSPINDFDNLNAPLFISHGTNDSRVSPTSMQGFIDKLNASDKDFELHLMQGLGHGGGSKEEDEIQYSKMMKFIENILD